VADGTARATAWESRSSPGLKQSPTRSSRVGLLHSCPIIAPMGRFELNSLAEYTDEAILQEMRRVASLHGGGPLTTSVFAKLSTKVSWSTIQKRFGGWRKALEAAGLAHLYVERHMPYRDKLQRGNGMSDAELISEMQRVHSLIRGAVLTTREFDRVSTTHADVIRGRFGDWRTALTKAGIPQSELGKRYTDEECFESLVVVWTHYGRPPQHNEMKFPPSTVGPKAYILRWGTWRKTLKAFVYWANGEGQPETTHEDDSEQMKEPSDDGEHVRAIRGEENCREVRPGLRFKVFMRDRFRCLACGRSPATHLNIELHADHIISVYDDGKTVYDNLQTLCQDCNLGKGRTSIR